MYTVPFKREQCPLEHGRCAQVPLPQLAEELLEERVADVAGRAALSPEALPSVAFFTFVNTHQSLNAVAFSPDGGWVISARRADCAVSTCRSILPVAMPFPSLLFACCSRQIQGWHTDGVALSLNFQLPALVILLVFLHTCLLNPSCEQC